MNTIKSLTLNDKTYDSFIDREAVKSINGVKPDGSGNANIEMPIFDGGLRIAALDYANLPDVSENLGTVTVYKVTDDILTEDILKKSIISVKVTDAEGAELTESLTIANFMGKQEFEFGNLFLNMICGSVVYFIVVATKTGQFEVDGDIYTVHQTGTYFALQPNGTETPNLMSLEYDYIKPLDIKFIPEALYAEIDRKIENYINEALGGEY